MIPPALQGLSRFRQFVCWIAVPNDKKPGKFHKFPVSPVTGAIIDAHAAEHWTDYATALALAPRWDRGHGSGAGFVITANDPVFFIDVDSCLTPTGWSPLALEICERFRGAAIEVSHSGQGLHVLGTADPIEHASRNTPLGLECYTQLRFVALTGRDALGDVWTNHTTALASAVAQWFAPTVAATPSSARGWTDGPCEGWGGPADDDELMRKAHAGASTGGLTGKTAFGDLYAGRVDEAARSEADQSLANHLAFWTGKDCVRIERLMRASQLVRDKWDEARPLSNGEPGTYLGRTIMRACAFVTEVAIGPKLPEPGPRIRTNIQEYMTTHDQLSWFDGCTYVTDSHTVFSVRNGRNMTHDQFNVLLGGQLFIMDAWGKKHSKSAFEAFTTNRANTCPTVDALCFRPELDLGQIIGEGNVRYLNSYTPYECETVAGDPTRFLDLLQRLLPNPQDRELLICYIASSAQNRGIKFQWWPVIQGTKGNGKTILIDVLTYIHGEQYTHLPNAHAMAKDGLKFNSWIDRKTFLGIEEIALQHKRDFLEELKIVVTNKRIPLERKGDDQVNTDNRANGMLCTNHRDGVPVDDDERRYAVFFTGQQSYADILRDGMGGQYFPDLYDWLNGRNAYEGRPKGFAVVAHWLKNYAIPVALDPARDLHRAPRTSSTLEAVAQSRGRAEQEVLEAIAEGRPGFGGGWVAGRSLDQLLDHARLNVPRNKRRQMMQALGYDWHPTLDDGRGPDRVRLYIRQGHPALILTDPASIVAAYADAQAPTSAPTSLESTVVPFPTKRS